MSKSTTDQKVRDPIQAAGGLVWRRSKEGYEIAVVHRKRDNDWTLPKGKLRKGESWEEAALREVQEETGWQVVITDFAGAITYQPSEQQKIVCFWHMTPIIEAVIADKDEILKMEWLPIAEARTRVKYPSEQALLANWQGPGITSQKRKWKNKLPSPISSEPWQISKYDLLSSASTKRLKPVFPIIEGELIVLKKSTKQIWYEPAQLLLKQARQAYDAGDSEAGWKLVKAVDRFMFYGLNHDRLVNKAKMILAESIDENKGVSKWRQDSIRALLVNPKTNDKPEELKEPVDVNRVIEAKKLLDEHADNIYQKIAILKNRLMLLSFIGMVWLVIWLVIWFIVSLLIPFETQNIGLSAPFGNMIKAPSLFWLVIVLSGVLGALISSFTSSIGSDPKKARIPTELSVTTVTLARLIVGALSSIAITLFISSGILSFPNFNFTRTFAFTAPRRSVTVALVANTTVRDRLRAKVLFTFLFAIAVVSGFSDRVLMSAIERVSNPK